MANNELSGPVLLNKIMDYVKSIPDNYYSYRFILLPETIGSIAYLSLEKIFKIMLFVAITYLVLVMRAIHILNQGLVIILQILLCLGFN